MKKPCDGIQGRATEAFLLRMFATGIMGVISLCSVSEVWAEPPQTTCQMNRTGTLPDPDASRYPYRFYKARVQ